MPNDSTHFRLESMDKHQEKGNERIWKKTGKKEENRGYPNNKIMCRVVYGKRHMACRAVQYATLMFYHNIQASDDTNNRIKQQSTKEVEKQLGHYFFIKK